jgi:integrase/recombinase XerC
VASVMGWAVEAVADYVENIRPRFGCGDHPALWVTERGGRVKPSEADSSTAVYTHVSSDFMNTVLRRALGPALDHPAAGGGR